MAKIVAVVTTDRERVAGGAPIFFAAENEELGQLVHLLEKVLDCMAHQLNGQLYILVERNH